MLSDDQKNILEFIEQLYDNKLKKRIIESCIQGESKISSNTPRVDTQGLIRNEGYSLCEVYKRMEVNESSKPIHINDLKREINALKTEIKHLREKDADQDRKLIELGFQMNNLPQMIKGQELNRQDKEKEEESTSDLLIINQILYQKWYVRIDLVIHNEFTIENAIALVDSGADMNCIQEGLVPTQYFEKTT